MPDKVVWSETFPYRMKMRLIVVMQLGAGLSLILEPHTVTSQLISEFVSPIAFLIAAVVGAGIILWDGMRGKRLNGIAVTPLTAYLTFAGGAGLVSGNPVPTIVSIIYGVHIMEMAWMVWHNAGERG
jgi:hypothetical protein